MKGKRIQSLPLISTSSNSLSRHHSAPYMIPKYYKKPSKRPCSPASIISRLFTSFFSSISTTFQHSVETPFLQEIHRFILPNFEQEEWFHTLLDECQIYQPSKRQYLISYCNEYFGTMHFDILTLSSYFRQPICLSDDEDMPIEAISFSNILYFLSMMIFYCLQFDQFSSIPIKKWKLFILQLQNYYRPNIPFHNVLHASDTTYTVFCLLYTVQPLTKDLKRRELVATVTLPYFYHLALVIAAILHDIGHFGLTNNFLRQVQHQYVSHYQPSVSTLEALHSDVGVKLLCYQEFAIFADYSTEFQMTMYAIIQELVLSTDLSKHHEILQQYHTKQYNAYLLPTSYDLASYLPSSMQAKEDILIMKFMIKIADLGHCTHQFESHLQWSEHLAKEMENEQTLKSLLKIEGGYQCKCYLTRCKNEKKRKNNEETYPIKERRTSLLQTQHLMIETNNTVTKHTLISPMLNRCKLAIQSPLHSIKKRPQFYCACYCQSQIGFIQKFVTPCLTIFDTMSQGKNQNVTLMTDNLQYNISRWEEELKTLQIT